jgi:hypothetical protein
VITLPAESTQVVVLLYVYVVGVVELSDRITICELEGTMSETVPEYVVVVVVSFSTVSPANATQPLSATPATALKQMLIALFMRNVSFRENVRRRSIRRNRDNP